MLIIGMARKSKRMTALQGGSHVRTITIGRERMQSAQRKTRLSYLAQAASEEGKINIMLQAISDILKTKERCKSFSPRSAKRKRRKESSKCPTLHL
jgi:hypothetical protein